MELHNVTSIQEMVCPTCGQKLNTAAKPDKPSRRPPKKGDPGLCMKCGELLVFGDNLEIHVATLDEMLVLPEGMRSELEHWQQWVRETRPLDNL